MDDTTLIVLFLAFTSVTVVTNSLLIWFAYRGFASVTLKITETVREIETAGPTREWLSALATASEQAVDITETTKQKMVDQDPVLQDLQVRYQFLLAKMDTKVERLSNAVSDNALRFRDAVEKPAMKIEAVAGSIQNTLGFLVPTADDD